jgi:hypothetical protein
MVSLDSRHAPDERLAYGCVSRKSSTIRVIEAPVGSVWFSNMTCCTVPVDAGISSSTVCQPVSHWRMQGVAFWLVPQATSNWPHSVGKG